MIKHTMKGIIVQDKRRILVRFCHGYEKLIWIGALRLRYEYLSQVELQEMMLKAKLSSNGKWLIFNTMTAHAPGNLGTRSRQAIVS